MNRLKLIETLKMALFLVLLVGLLVGFRLGLSVAGDYLSATPAGHKLTLLLHPPLTAKQQAQQAQGMRQERQTSELEDKQDAMMKILMAKQDEESSLLFDSGASAQQQDALQKEQDAQMKTVLDQFAKESRQLSAQQIARLH